MYKVKFRDDQDKQVYSVHCRTQDLDLRGHPYFVVIHQIIQPHHSPIIAIDNKEKQRFQNTKSVMIPVSNISLIEEVEDEQPRISKVPAAKPPKKEVSAKNLKT